MRLFVPAPQSPRGFAIREIDRPLAIAARGLLFPVEASRAPGSGPGVAWLVPWQGEAFRRGVVLLARPGRLRVNGRPVLPLTALERGDEIRVDGVSLFFTDEAPVRVVPYDPGVGSTRDSRECTRCHGPIQNGDPVVHCPVCLAVYMAQPDRSPNCWEFGPCLSCGRDPQLEFAWQPREARSSLQWGQRTWRKATMASQPQGVV
jgi:hypothetical protein